jgi:hypothetical protein
MRNIDILLFDDAQVGAVCEALWGNLEQKNEK